MKKYIKIEHLVIDDFWVYKATDKDGYVALNYMFGTSDEDYEIFKKEYCKADEWFTTWYITIIKESIQMKLYAQ